MSSIDHLHSETKMLQVEDHLNLISAQYLVQCLDTENVCHHFTKMDLPPREMKETIFTRHFKTMLPLLANNKKDTLQALYISFVNTYIDNMKDNRVINNRPPPINDEETFLLVLLLFAFRDLWKEWGASNFHRTASSITGGWNRWNI